MMQPAESPLRPPGLGHAEDDGGDGDGTSRETAPVGSGGDREGGAPATRPPPTAASLSSNGSGAPALDVSPAQLVSPSIPTLDVTADDTDTAAPPAASSRAARRKLPPVPSQETDLGVGATMQPVPSLDADLPLDALDNVVFNADEEHLSCVGVGLKRVPDWLVDEYAGKVTRLDLSNNKLKTLDGVERFSGLRELLADANQLGDDCGFPALPRLTTLSLNKNRILDLQPLLAKLRESCPGITFLSLIGNGACPNGLIWGTSAAEYARYRRETALALPALQFLDSTPVSAADRPRPAGASGGGADAPPQVTRESLRRDLPDKSTATLEFFDDAAGKKNPFLRALFKHRVTSLALLADKWIVSGGTDGVLKVFDLSEGRWQYKCVAILKGHATRVRSVACFPDVRVVSASDDRTVRVWNLAKQQCVRTLKGHQGPVRAVRTFKDGRLVSCSDDGLVCVWETARNTPVTMQGHSGPVVCVEVVSETLVLSGGVDQTVRFWDLTERSCLASVNAHAGAVTALAHLGDGLIATGSADSTVKVWRMRDRFGAECEQTLRGHWGGVSTLAVLRDGSLVSSGADRVVARWDVAAGQCTRVLGGHDSGVNALAVTSGGGKGGGKGGGTAPQHHFATCAESIKLWRLDDGGGNDDGNGGDGNSGQAGQSPAEAALVARFNEATAAGDVGAEGTSIWDAVKSVFNPAEMSVWSRSEAEAEAARALAEKHHAYASLTAACPSTVGMFAASYLTPAAAGGAAFADGDRGAAAGRMSLETWAAAHGTRLSEFSNAALEALFSNDALSNPLKEINAKVQAWKTKMRRRRGPNMLDWIGSVDEKRTQEAMDRLVELCDLSRSKRLTYLAIKNKLIDEFGEDVYTHMKEQVSVELAMRDLEAKETPAPQAVRAAPPARSFFPETSRLIAPQVSTEEDEEELLAPPAVHRPKVDVANLYSLFDQIGEMAHEESDRELELAQQLERRVAGLEAGDEVVSTIPVGPNVDESELYAYIIENSRLLTASEPVPDDAGVLLDGDGAESGAAEEGDGEGDAGAEAASPPPPPPKLVLQNQVWA